MRLIIAGIALLCASFAFAEALLLRVGAALEDGGVGIPPCPLD